MRHIFKIWESLMRKRFVSQWLKKLLDGETFPLIKVPKCCKSVSLSIWLSYYDSSISYCFLVLLITSFIAVLGRESMWSPEDLPVLLHPVALLLPRRYFLPCSIPILSSPFPFLLFCPSSSVQSSFKDTVSKFRFLLRFDFLFVTEFLPLTS